MVDASRPIGSLRGDSPCSRCHSPENIVWFTESVFWNAVIRTEPSPWAHNEPILCFVVEAEEMGYRPTGWRLLPEGPWAQNGSGRA